MKHLVLVGVAISTPNDELPALRGCVSEFFLPKLQVLVGVGSVRVCCSSHEAPYAAADVLGRGFSVVQRPEGALRYEPRNGLDDFTGTMQLVARHEDDADVLVLVADIDHAAWFPRYFARERLRTSFTLQPRESGIVHVINCSAKSIETSRF